MRRGKKKGQETLTQALSHLLETELLPDLEARAKLPAIAVALERRWKHEQAAHRTAERLDAWTAQTLEQVGAAWILSCVFVRTLEDRGLLARRRLAGEGAGDSLDLFIQIAPELGVRDYLLTVFREVSRLPGAEELLGPARNPAWRLSPSETMARRLLDLFQEAGEDGVGLRWSFGSDDTRFLGDLYQDLSEAVRKRFALLQTPEFVERFILGLTLDPALKEFGLPGLRVIDPTCGSGHFLLGAYDRLFDAHLAAAPGVDPRQNALAALEQVYGVDINPYAVAIARFRLTLSFLTKAGITKLAEAPRLPLNLVVADSLLHGAKGVTGRLAEAAEDKAGWHDELFTLEDEAGAKRVLGQGYHVVVGNPPYVTCKDAALRELYRQSYPRSAAGKFALAAPFTERFFQLGVESGFVGLINANSFMKREFGKKLIEGVLPTLDMTHVLDTAGAYIPGHGTPTVILAGRNRRSFTPTLRAALGRRGEPTTPANPKNGKVWASIAQHVGEVGFENEYVSIVDIEREKLEKHPWSLGGGGAGDLKERLETDHATLSTRVESIGITCFTLEDDAYTAPAAVLQRARVEDRFARQLVEGEFIRDWSLTEGNHVVFPYSATFQPTGDASQALAYLWPYRTSLSNNLLFGSKRKIDGGLRWYEFGRLTSAKLKSPLSIAFAFVATHNHFVLDRGGKVFKQSAPIIKLPGGATEEEHLALLGYLNSSTACFWMKQAFFDKGNRGGERGTPAEKWEGFFEFDGTKLAALPMVPPTPSIAGWSRLLDEAGRGWLALDPSVVLEQAPVAVTLGLTEARTERLRLERKIRWLQEELDWDVYRAFGLPSVPPASVPPSLKATPERLPGSRPADRLYAQAVLDGAETERYFRLCGLSSPSDVLSAPVAPLDAARLELIAREGDLQLIEHPAYKRTYRESFRPWDEKPALKAWLLDRLEIELRGALSPSSLRTLASRVLTDGPTREGAQILFGDDADLIAELAALVKTDAVTHLAALRHTVTGLDKRAQWEATWDLQRREDQGEKVGEIPVPPKYGREDYRDDVFWRHRGKLDVPKERFVSYPGAEREGEGMLLGWAGWDHLQRAQALAALYNERRHGDGWPRERLVPLLAGLWELVPWLKQWHDEPSPEHDGVRLGSYYESYVQNEARGLGLTVEDLRAWRPEPGARGRRAKPMKVEDEA